MTTTTPPPTPTPATSATPAGLFLQSTVAGRAPRWGSRGPDGAAAPRTWRGWWHADRGSVAAEVTLLAPFLLLLLVFVAVFVHRGVEVRLRLDDAAHQAARAASIERSAPAAVAAAQSTATAALASVTATCVGLTVDTATAAMRPGGTVTVTLTCMIDVGDAVLLGVPGQTRMLATATEPVDTYRSVTTTGSGGTG